MKTKKKIVFLMHLCQHTMQDNYIRESDNPNRFPPLKKTITLFIDIQPPFNLVVSLIGNKS